MISARIRTWEEFRTHRKDNNHVFKKIKAIEDRLTSNNEGEFTVKGFSYPAQAEVDFLVDRLYSSKTRINWRERVVCPITKLNNRLRATIHFMDFELNPTTNSKIYIAEQLTPLYDILKKKYPNIIGSEFLGIDFMPGALNEQNIRHEDATNLSFKDNELDFYLTFECFEHIPDFKKAFAESYRVLKPGGMLYWTVPFVHAIKKNMIRATISENGTITHLMKPDYHGDPINASEGILCYTYFGWEMFDQLKEVGFKDAYAINYWSDSLGYYNRNQFLFCAIK